MGGVEPHCHCHADSRVKRRLELLAELHRLRWHHAYYTENQARHNNQGGLIPGDETSRSLTVRVSNPARFPYQREQHNRRLTVNT